MANPNKNIFTATILFYLNTAKINSKIMLFVICIILLNFADIQCIETFRIWYFYIYICIKKVVIPNLYIFHNSANR